MPEIKAILLIPEKGDPLGLLADGVCGARPPTAVRCTDPRVVHIPNGFADPTVPCEVCKACGQPWPCDTPGKMESEGHVRWQPGNRHTTMADALVLAWGGKTVWRGAVWAECVLAALDCAETPSWRLANRVTRAMVERRPAAVNMLRRLIGELGTLVLLDAEGREIT